jgi:hypothetical protein
LYLSAGRGGTVAIIDAKEAPQAYRLIKEVPAGNRRDVARPGKAPRPSIWGGLPLRPGMSVNSFMQKENAV